MAAFLKKYGFLFMILLAGSAFWHRQARFYRPSFSFPPDGQVVFSEPEKTGDILHLIPLEEIVQANASPEAVAPVNAPQYESVFLADQYLHDNGKGIMIEADGQARFYPFQILVWHEVVNDSFKGVNLLVSYAPLCDCGRVYERGTSESSAMFQPSGSLWNNDTLLRDDLTEFLWSSVMGKALVGSSAGTTLAPYDSFVTSWKDFKNAYPNGEVLSTETGYERDYTTNPYAAYQTSSQIWFPLSRHDTRLSARTKVVGSPTDDRTYLTEEIERSKIINDTTAVFPLLLIWDERLHIVRGYARTLDETILTFHLQGDMLEDDQTGSLWNLAGEALSGTYRGRALRPVALQEMFWFCRAAMYPETRIYSSTSA